MCKFCDTEFVGTDGPSGGKFDTAQDLARAVAACWPSATANDSRLVVCTGGEPLLQVDQSLTAAFHQEHFEIAVETNGTQSAVPGLDWVCVSPKADAKLVITQGNELKLVYPQADAIPQIFEKLGFDHFFLQPMDGPNVIENTRLAIEYCKQHPRWRLSLQTHKLLGIP